MAYGVSRGRVGSYMTLGDSGEALDARLGDRIEPDAPHAEDLSVDFRAEPAGSGAQEHGLGMDLNWQW